MPAIKKRRSNYQPARSIPKATFCRLVRELTDDCKSDMKWSAPALRGLQEEAELFIKEHFERASSLSGRFNHRTVGLRHFNDGRGVPAAQDE